VRARRSCVAVEVDDELRASPFALLGREVSIEALARGDELLERFERPRLCEAFHGAHR